MDLLCTKNSAQWTSFAYSVEQTGIIQQSNQLLFVCETELLNVLNIHSDCQLPDVLRAADEQY